MAEVEREKETVVVDKGERRPSYSWVWAVIIIMLVLILFFLFGGGSLFGGSSSTTPSVSAPTTGR